MTIINPWRPQLVLSLFYFNYCESMNRFWPFKFQIDIPLNVEVCWQVFCCFVEWEIRKTIIRSLDLTRQPFLMEIKIEIISFSDFGFKLRCTLVENSGRGPGCLKFFDKGSLGFQRVPTFWIVLLLIVFRLFTLFLTPGPGPLPLCEMKF